MTRRSLKAVPPGRLSRQYPATEGNQLTPPPTPMTMDKTAYTITHQPISQASMSSTCPVPLSKSSGGCCGNKSKCHARRLRTLLPALVALLTIAALAIWFLCSDMGMSELAADVGSSLWKRQSSSSSTSDDSPFVKNKRESFSLIA